MLLKGYCNTTVLLGTPLEELKILMKTGGQVELLTTKMNSSLLYFFYLNSIMLLAIGIFVMLILIILNLYN